MFESIVKTYLPNEADLRVSIDYKDRTNAVTHTLGLVSSGAHSEEPRLDQSLGYNAIDKN